jgi:hypothetical protein
MTRRSVRIGAEVQVVDAVTGRAYRATDISTSGLFLEGAQHLAPGSVQRLALSFGGREVSLNARVARKSDRGVGLVLVEPSPGNLAALSELLDAALAASGSTVDEKRGAPRASGAGVTRWSFSGVERLGMLEDLSSTGAAIRSDEVLPDGTRVKITLVQQPTGSQVSTEALVVRRTERGFAVRFESASPEFIAAVSQRGGAASQR